MIRYTQAPQAQLSQSLESYTEATRHSAAPDPLPLYAEKLGWLADQARVPDIQYTLLQLCLRPESGADLAQLLSPEGYTPEPLDALLPWLLLGVLQAIGAVQPQAASQIQVRPPRVLRLTIPYYQYPITCRMNPCLPLAMKNEAPQEISLAR